MEFTCYRYRVVIWTLDKLCIQIRIPKFRMPHLQKKYLLTDGSGFGSCCFRQWPSSWQLKTIFSKLLFITFWIHLHSFSKIKSENSRNEEFYYFCFMIEGSGSVPRINGSGRLKNIRIPNMVFNCWHGSVVFRKIMNEREQLWGSFLCIKLEGNFNTWIRSRIRSPYL